MPQFIVGINYWPARTALAMWRQFDPDVVDEDFGRIADAGLTLVRFFLTWDVFQPEPERIDPAALDAMERLLHIAQARGLRTMPTFFCGHMSGVNWLPGWTLSPGAASGRFRTISDGVATSFGVGDFYTGGPLLAAQREHVRAVGARFAQHPAIATWDLGNEFSNLREPRSPVAAAQWSAILTQDLLETSGIGVTGGLHGEDLERDRHIRPSSIAAPWAYATMHGYPVYSGFARGRTDPEVVPFLHDVAMGMSGKPVLFSEFGNPSCPPGLRSPYDVQPVTGPPPAAGSGLAPYACLDEDEMATYAYAVLDRLHERGALGALWWCFSDYDPALAGTPPFDRAPHELRFGAWRADGSPKPVVAALARFAAERRTVAPVIPPVYDEDAWYTPPMALAERYCAYVERVETRT